MDELPAGAERTIVHEHVPGKMFIVEFCDDDGRTLALLDLPVDVLDLVQAFKN